MTPPKQKPPKQKAAPDANESAYSVIQRIIKKTEAAPKKKTSRASR